MSARWTLALAWIVVATTVIALPHVLRPRWNVLPHVPYSPARSTKPLPSADPRLDEQFFGISRDRMMLYTPPGFARPIPQQR